MKNIVSCLISVAFALAFSSCAQMKSPRSKSKAVANSGNPYGSTQTFPTQQGANPYETSPSYGNDTAYGQYQQSAGQNRDADYVNVTPATPQYGSTTPQYGSSTPQYGNTAPQYANTAPQYPSPGAPNPQMGSYQGAAQPAPPASYPPQLQPAQPGPSMVAQTHVVQPGETLYHISRIYDTTVDGIKGVNGLNSNLIHPGEVLSIP